MIHSKKYFTDPRFFFSFFLMSTNSDVQLHISPAHPDYTDALLAFELENRAHFEHWIASRGDLFYSTEAVRKSLEQAQWAAHARTELHYLVWLGEEIIGRITLRGIEREQYFKASLGYRFSARHGGKGYASTAVNKIIEHALTELKLWRIEATIIANNLPSIGVIRKCGFTQYGHSHASILRNGTWMDALHFENTQNSLMTAN